MIAIEHNGEVHLAGPNLLFKVYVSQEPAMCGACGRVLCGLSEPVWLVAAVWPTIAYCDKCRWGASNLNRAEPYLPFYAFTRRYVAPNGQVYLKIGQRNPTQLPIVCESCRTQLGVWVKGLHGCPWWLCPACFDAEVEPQEIAKVLEAA